MAAPGDPSAKPQDLERLLHAVLSTAEAVPRAHASVWLIDPAGATLTCRGRSSRFVGSAAVDADRALPFHHLVHFHDQRPHFELREEVFALLEAGIWLRDQVVGFVRFERSTGEQWQITDVEKAADLASEVAAVLERSGWQPPRREPAEGAQALSWDEYLLQPIAGANPAGENLRYTSIHVRIEEARHGHLALPEGDSQTTGKQADWPLVIQLTTEALATLSKDLHFGVGLTEARLHRDGFSGLRQGLDLLREMLLRFWDHLYPELEDGDAEARAFVLERLDHLEVSVKRLPLTNDGHSYFQYTESVAVPSDREAHADVLRRAQREKAISEGKLTPEAFYEAFRATPAEWYEALAEDLVGSLNALTALEEVGKEKFDSEAPRYPRLRQALLEFWKTANWLHGKKVTSVLGAPGADVAPSPAPVLGKTTVDTDLQTVHLGVSAPVEARPGDVFAVAFVAYLAAATEEVRRQLTELNPLAQPRLGVATHRWKRGTRVRVRLSGKHLKADPHEQEFTWEGDRHLIAFAVEVAGRAPLGSTVLKIEVFVAGFRVALIPLQLLIRSDAASVRLRSTVEVPYRTAFASYAAEDRDEVLGRVASLTAATGIDVFLDCLSLHPGEEWKPRLQEEILRRDVLYLIWCSHAVLSQWVEWEWRTALALKGLSAIEPHPLTTVEDAEPPPELRELHFGDAYMLARAAFNRRLRWSFRGLIRELLGGSGHR